MNRIRNEDDSLVIKGISFALLKKSKNITLFYSAVMLALFTLIRHYAGKVPASDASLRMFLYGISYIFFFFWVIWFILILIPIKLKIDMKTGDINTIWLGLFPQKIGTKDDVKEILVETRWESEKSEDQAPSGGKKVVMLKFKSERIFPVIITGNDDLAQKVSLELKKCIDVPVSES